MEKSQDNKQLTFGEFFRLKRIETGLTLRSFCERFGYDPANISRLERDILPPPEDKDKLEALANALYIKKETKDWVEFFDLAYLSKGKIPADISSRKEINQYLPLLFRTIRGKRLSKEKLQKLIKLLNSP
jgi:transcriptional regulator with XRE-family HTH domain